MIRRVVVTGGAGVIGQTLVDSLVARGDSVRVIDRLPPPASMYGEVDYVQGDLNVLGPSVVSGYSPQVIFHLAATFERSEETPEFWLPNAQDNVAASVVVLEGALNSPQLERYVFASSYLTYDPDSYLFPEPPNRVTQLFENSPIRPRNACGAAKFLHETELALVTSGNERGFSAVSARIFRVYGPSSRDVVSRWIRSAVRNEPISVFGVESSFDYIFSGDVAQGLVRLADSDVSGIVNLGSGKSRSVREVIACLESHFPNLESGLHLPSDCYEASEANVDHLRNSIAWVPPTELEYGIARLVEHERDLNSVGRIEPRLRKAVSAGIFISSVGGKAHIVRGARSALECRNAHGTVWGGDSNPIASAAKLTDGFWRMPRVDSLDVGELIQFCQANSIRLIVPTRDGELSFYAANRDVLSSHGIFVPLGDSESIEVTQDKVLFARALESLGVPVVATGSVVSEIDASNGQFVAKPRTGSGGIGVRLGLSKAQTESLLATVEGLIVQPYLLGDEYSVDSYIAQDGRLLGAVPRHRVSVVSGEARITIVVNRPEIAELGAQAAEACKLKGHVVTQIIDDGIQPRVIECNSRIGGASSASWVYGLRSIDAMLVESLGEEVQPFRTSYADLKMTRLPEDHFEWK